MVLLCSCGKNTIFHTRVWKIVLQSISKTWKYLDSVKNKKHKISFSKVGKEFKHYHFTLSTPENRKRLTDCHNKNDFENAEIEKLELTSVKYIVNGSRGIISLLMEVDQQEATTLKKLFKLLAAHN